MRAWWHARRRRRYRECLHTWLRDLRRDPSPNRVRRFGQALVLAHELDGQVVHLHAHFLHTPASVARYASILLDLPWSCSAHARDIWTCTAANHRHLRELAPDPGHVELVYHGLDPRRFPPVPESVSDRDGSDPDRPVRILSVGRAVEKKGYQDLLLALALLPPSLHWRFQHVGGGAWLARLKRLAVDLGVADRIEWSGAMSQGDVLDCYGSADLFVLSSRIAGDGDRDGLPNVLMEAQSQGLPCVATRISAIPELIVDADTGLLAEAGDAPSIAEAVGRLIRDPALRRRLGEAGRKRVADEFQFGVGVDRLRELFAAATAETDR